jgi:hypothetical protein
LEQLQLCVTLILLKIRPNLAQEVSLNNSWILFPV